MAEAVQQLVDEHLLPAVYAQAWRLLQTHREADTACWCRPADFWSARRAERQATHILGGPAPPRTACFTGAPGGPGYLCRGQGELCRSLAGGQQARVRRSYFYSDSHNDLPLLHWVSDPRPTNPNARLQAEAQRLGWPCLWLDPQQAASAWIPGFLSSHQGCRLGGARSTFHVNPYCLPPAR